MSGNGDRFGIRSPRGQLSCEVELKPAEAKRCLVTTDLGPIYLRNEFLHAKFLDKEVTYLLIGERYLHLPRARLRARFVRDKIEISTDVFARQVTLEMDGVTGAVFEDNYFDMPPGQKRTIAVVHDAGGRQIIVKALNSDPARLERHNTQSASTMKGMTQ